MSQEIKQLFIANGSHEHVEEFGDCVGVVIGPVDYGDGAIYPEVDVRWQPSNLKYAYDAKYLVNINPLPEHLKKVLLSEDNSKPNKLWMAIAWWYNGYYIDWQWQGIERYSRLQFKFSEDGSWITAKSHEEDVISKMKSILNKKNKED
jgi:hypothetical protein